jgi:hypothetical protein
MGTGKSTKIRTVKSILTCDGTSLNTMTFQEYLKLHSLHLDPPCQEFVLHVKKTYPFKTEVEITPVNESGKPFRAYVSGSEIYPLETIDKLESLLTKIASSKKKK